MPDTVYINGVPHHVIDERDGLIQVRRPNGVKLYWPSGSRIRRSTVRTWRDSGNRGGAHEGGALCPCLDPRPGA